MDSTCDHLHGTRHEHCVKNDLYQLIGGSCPTSIDNSHVDTDFLTQVDISKDLVAPKDFALEKN